MSPSTTILTNGNKVLSANLAYVLSRRMDHGALNEWFASPMKLTMLLGYGLAEEEGGTTSQSPLAHS